MKLEERVAEFERKYIGLPPDQRAKVVNVVQTLVITFSPEQGLPTEVTEEVMGILTNVSGKLERGMLDLQSFTTLMQESAPKLSQDVAHAFMAQQISSADE